MALRSHRTMKAGYNSRPGNTPCESGLARQCETYDMPALTPDILDRSELEAEQAIRKGIAQEGLKPARSSILRLASRSCGIAGDVRLKIGSPMASNRNG